MESRHQGRQGWALLFQGSVRAGSDLSRGRSPKRSGQRSSTDIDGGAGALRAPLFTSDRTGGHHWRDWPREQVGRICKLAGVPVVTAHGMRGLRATLEVLAGRGLEGAAAALRHNDQGATAARSYVAPGAAQGAASERVFRILKGGAG